MLKVDKYEGEADLYGYTVTDTATGIEVSRVDATLTNEEAEAAVASLQAEYAAQQPITHLAFLRRLTMQERISMRTLAKTDPIAQDCLALFDAATNISVTDADTVQGVAYFIQQGCIAADRQAAILAAPQPEEL